MIIKTYKNKRRIICYIIQTAAGAFKVCTGKPSDSECISWKYNTLEEAESTAEEYFINYTTGPRA